MTPTKEDYIKAFKKACSESTNLLDPEKYGTGVCIKKDDIIINLNILRETRLSIYEDVNPNPFNNIYIYYLETEYEKGFSSKSNTIPLTEGEYSELRKTYKECFDVVNLSLKEKGEQTLINYITE